MQIDIIPKILQGRSFKWWDESTTNIMIWEYNTGWFKKKVGLVFYRDTHYFDFVNQTLSLKLKAHFTAISFQKAVVLHFFIRIIDLFNGLKKNILFQAN